MNESSGPDLVGSERDVLLHYLNKNRDAVVCTSEGLTDEQQRTAGVPSGTNLLGLVQHLTGVEVHWFERVFLGQGEGISESMAVPAGTTRDEVVAAYRRRARAATRSCARARTSPRRPGRHPARADRRRDRRLRR
jgi:hypothetical protein